MNNHLQRLSKKAGQRALVARLIGPLALLTGAALLLAYFIQSGFLAMFAPKSELVTVAEPATKQITSTDALINGYDRDGLPFVITSVTATQDSENSKIVNLEGPHGVFTRHSDKTIELSAKTARYNTETKLLNLEGDVVFAQTGSYKARMLKADLNLDDMGLTSRSPVHVEMDSGSVDADHLEISDNGKKTLFTGHVKANLKSDIESGIVP